MKYEEKLRKNGKIKEENYEIYMKDNGSLFDMKNN